VILAATLSSVSGDCCAIELIVTAVCGRMYGVRLEG
jgi:hypothetical protein